MKIEIYGKPNCPACNESKIIANRIGEVTYTDVVTQSGQLELLSKRMGETPKSVPQIFIDNVYIGGIVELKAFVAEKERTELDNITI